MKTKTYKVSGMDCDSCAKMIELDFEDQGISAKCDFAKESLEVSEEVSKEKVERILKSSGYTINL